MREDGAPSRISPRRGLGPASRAGLAVAGSTASGREVDTHEPRPPWDSRHRARAGARRARPTQVRRVGAPADPSGRGWRGRSAHSRCFHRSTVRSHRARAGALLAAPVRLTATRLRGPDPRSPGGSAGPTPHGVRPAQHGSSPTVSEPPASVPSPPARTARREHPVHPGGSARGRRVSASRQVRSRARSAVLPTRPRDGHSRCREEVPPPDLPPRAPRSTSSASVGQLGEGRARPQRRHLDYAQCSSDCGFHPRSRHHDRSRRPRPRRRACLDEANVAPDFDVRQLAALIQRGHATPVDRSPRFPSPRQAVGVIPVIVKRASIPVFDVARGRDTDAREVLASVGRRWVDLRRSTTWPVLHPCDPWVEGPQRAVWSPAMPRRRGIRAGAERRRRQTRTRSPLRRRAAGARSQLGRHRGLRRTGWRARHCAGTRGRSFSTSSTSPGRRLLPSDAGAPATRSAAPADPGLGAASQFRGDGLGRPPARVCAPLVVPQPRRGPVGATAWARRAGRSESPHGRPRVASSGVCALGKPTMRSSTHGPGTAAAPRCRERRLVVPRRVRLVVPTSTGGPGRWPYSNPKAPPISPSRPRDTTTVALRQRASTSAGGAPVPDGGSAPEAGRSATGRTGPRAGPSPGELEVGVARRSGGREAGPGPGWVSSPPVPLPTGRSSKRRRPPPRACDAGSPPHLLRPRRQGRGWGGRTSAISGPGVDRGARMGITYPG